MTLMVWGLMVQARTCANLRFAYGVSLRKTPRRLAMATITVSMPDEEVVPDLTLRAEILRLRCIIALFA